MGFFKSLFSKYEPPVELIRSTARSCANKIMGVFYDYTYSGTRSLEDRCFLHVESSYWDSSTKQLYFTFWNCIGATCFWEYKRGESLNEYLTMTTFLNALSDELKNECKKYLDTKFPAGSYGIVTVSSAHWDYASVSDEEKYLGITVSFDYRCRK